MGFFCRRLITRPGKVLVGNPRRFHKLFDLRHDLRMLIGDVVLLADVVLQIVELYRAIGFLGDVEPDALPAPHTDRLLLALLVKFPV